MSTTSRKSVRGFTLVELAVAFLIIGLLLSAAMIPLSAQIEVRYASDTRRTMDQIREAIIGFAQANGRLPCPALGTLASSATGAGSEQWDSVNNRCSAVLGVIPWTALGVPENDAWGRRFTYRVSPAFADSVSLTTWQSRATAYIPPSGSLAQTTASPASPFDQSPGCDLTSAPLLSSFALCSLGDMTVLTRSEANHAVFTPIGSGLPAVFISHGKNGKGAFQPNGIRLAIAAGADEAANANGTTTAVPGSGYNNYLSYTFYSRNPTSDATGCSDTAGTLFCEFDDLVVMISTPTLIARMVSAGKLP